MSAGGDLVWLGDQDYLLLRYAEQLLTIESFTCSPSLLTCDDFSEQGAYSDPGVQAFRAASFPGGFVVGTLAENPDGYEVFFRVFSANKSTGQVEIKPVRSQPVEVCNEALRTFDVGATLVDGDLWVAAAVGCREGSVGEQVDVHGLQFPDFVAGQF